MRLAQDLQRVNQAMQSGAQGDRRPARSAVTALTPRHSPMREPPHPRSSHVIEFPPRFSARLDLGCRDNEIKISDCLHAAPQTTCSLGSLHVGQRPQAIDDRFGHGGCFPPNVSLSVSFAIPDPCNDFLLSFGAESVQFRHPTRGACSR